MEVYWVIAVSNQGCVIMTLLHFIHFYSDWNIFWRQDQSDLAVEFSVVLVCKENRSQDKEHEIAV